MKSILVISVVCAFCAVIFAAQYDIPAHPEFPGMCVYERKLMDPGKNDFHNQCTAVYCNPDGSMLQETCDPFMVPNCRAGALVNVTPPFPECCKRYFHCYDNTGKELVNEYSPF